MGEKLICLNNIHPQHFNQSFRGVDPAKNLALRMVRCGELSKAACILTSSGLAPASDETVSKHRAKHPKRSCKSMVVHSPDSASINLSKFHLLNTIHGLPRGSGVGPSGWRYEHIKALVENSLHVDLVHNACSIIAKRGLPNEVLQLISASQLIASSKGKWRYAPSCNW